MSKRTIKFRAWDTETKEMSYDFLSKNWLKVCIESPYVELMQYTDITDRNEKEIYEGDVLKDVEDGSGLYQVVWCHDCWHLIDANRDAYDNGDYYQGHEVSWNRFVVIGNMYENPNLLKLNRT